MIHISKEKLNTNDNEEMRNAVRFYDTCTFQGIHPKEGSDEWGLYKYGEWIVKNIL